ncbi:hypothetical protein Tco_0573197 [Tanacetum coccineum]
MDYQCTQPSEEIDKIIQRTQERGIEICRQNEELNRVHEETMQILRELIKVQDEKRIAIEKEAAELEAKRKSQECLNIEEKSIPQASIRSRKSRIDPTLRNFTISTKRIPFSTVKTVNSLKMGDKHLDTQKGSLESSVKDPIPIPRESDVISDDDCDDDYQKRFDLKVQQLWMPSIYDENNKIRECHLIRSSAITPDLPIPDSLIMEDEHLDTIPNDDSPESHFLTFDNPLFDSNDDFSSDDESLSEEEIQKDEFKYFSNPLYDLDDEIITNEKILPNQKDLDVVIPIPPGIDERDRLFLASDDSMPPGIEIVDYDSEGDIRFLEELLSSDSPPLPENESFSLDHFDDPSLPRPPPEPPDVEICFNFEPDAGVVTKKVVGDISEHDVLMLIFYPPQPTLCPVFNLLSIFIQNEDKVFNMVFSFLLFSISSAKITFDFSECPSDDFWRGTFHLDVPYLHFLSSLDQTHVWEIGQAKTLVNKNNRSWVATHALSSSNSILWNERVIL